MHESNCADYVVIRDGINSWSKKIMSLCGGQDVTELVVRSFGSGMRVEFVSDREISKSGFLASYTSHLIPGNGNYLSFSVWIQSFESIDKLLMLLKSCLKKLRHIG